LKLVLAYWRWTCNYAPYEGAGAVFDLEGRRMMAQAEFQMNRSVPGYSLFDAMKQEKVCWVQDCCQVLWGLAPRAIQILLADDSHLNNLWARQLTMYSIYTFGHSNTGSLIRVRVINSGRT